MNTNDAPLASLAQLAQAIYRKSWESSHQMSYVQRCRMIERFHERKLAASRDSQEHNVCACVVLSLAYGASPRTVNRVARETRAKFVAEAVCG